MQIAAGHVAGHMGTSQPMHIAAAAGLSACDFPGALFTTSPSFPKVVGVRNAAGYYLSLSPKLSGNVALQQTFDIGKHSLGLAANYSFRSKYYFEPDNRIAQPAYGIMNATLSWSWFESPAYFELWGQNLLGAKYMITAFGTAPGGDIVAPGAPRTFGFRVGARL